MSLPGFTADVSLSKSSESYHSGGAFAAPATGNAIVPQVCVGSPCLRLPSGRFCVNLPILGRRCVNIPALGRWQIRCCTQFFPPFVRCGLNRCG